jgi:hypothetical protein
VRRLLLLAVLTLAAAAAGSSAAATSPWAAAADKVCVAWSAKAKTALAPLGTPKTPAQVYRFVVTVRLFEVRELAALGKIPGRTPAATRALASVRTDIAEVDSAIAAWKKGDQATFGKIVVRYLNDHRPRAAFAAAGATKCA